MTDTEPQPTRADIAGICQRLRRIAAGLHDKSVEELGTGRPVAQNVAEAIDALEAVCTDMQKFTSAPPDPHLDHKVDQERMARAVSELKSGEYDVQG